MTISRVLLLIATVSCVYCAPATARVPGPDARRQLGNCMLTKMRADQRESYLDALKTCKAQLAATPTRNQPAVAMNETGGATPAHSGAGP